MNTVASTEKTNSLEQDKQVNPQQSQLTSTDVEQKQSTTSFVSQFDTQASSKKEAKSSNVKLSTNDVHVYYGESEAIKGIDLNIYENEVIAFIGPSGCGKSTFLRTLNRMNDTIDSCRVTGKVMLDNQDIYDPNLDVVLLRAQVGMVFQKPNPFPKSIFDNVSYGPKLHGLARDKYDLEEIVENSLRKAGLWDEVKDRLNASAMGMSGGQQQRLCIARVMAVEPEVVLMDEPCSALDPISTMKIEELIAEIKQQYTIVMVTHNMQQAARVSDYTAFFLNGKLIEHDETNVIFTKPHDKKTEDYITGRFG